MYARTHHRAVTGAMAGAPQRNAQFSRRIADLQPRVDSLGQRVAVARSRQAEYLASLAVHELQAQKDRLAEYAAQARYALAALYDRGTATIVAPADGAAP